MAEIALHSITLRTLEETCEFGRILAEEATLLHPIPVLLLHGPLGCGKTSLIRALVEALPGSDAAEISSPSFTVCNHYPTSPPVLHCDLYRCAGAVPDELFEALDQAGTLTAVEWAEYLRTVDRPEEYLDILLKSCKETRLLTLRAHGRNAEQLLRQLLLRGLGS